MSHYRFPSDGAAVVFGGSGGLGSGVVELMSRSGTDVAFTYFKNKDAADALIGKVEENGRKGMAASVDLMDIAAVQSFVDSVKERFGRIHSVVFATGPFLNILPIMDAEPDVFYETLDTDVKGFYHVLRAVVPALRESGGSITALTTAAIHKYISTDGLSSIPKSGCSTFVYRDCT